MPHKIACKRAFLDRNRAGARVRFLFSGENYFHFRENDLLDK